MHTQESPAKTASQTAAPLLDIRNLSVEFALDSGIVRAVDHVDLTVDNGGILGLVGESGSGKSVTALAVLGLIGSRRARISSGEIHFQGEDLLAGSEARMRAVRGGKIGLVSQNALSALDPSFRIGDQLIEVIRLHQRVDRTAAAQIALESLEIVALPEAARRMRSYPHELSGGQRQRVVIALALACRPDLLIADEPTTALDATVQQQILDLLLEINKEFGTSILMVTHDFGVVAHMCTSVAVMRKGLIVEHGPADEIISSPKHPYTQGLMSAVPRLRLSEMERKVPRSERRLPVFSEASAVGERKKDDHATV